MTRRRRLAAIRWHHTEAKRIAEHHNDAACKLALKEIEARARSIMRKHPCATEFVMAMGVAFFVMKGDRHATNSSRPKYTDPLFDFIDEWDHVFHLTGTPMRFTADGPVITEW